MRNIFWLFTFLAMFSGPGQILAEEHLVGWPTEFDGRLPMGFPEGEGWKVVSGDGSLISSYCIGEYSSPTCIADTMMACDAWSPVDEATSNDGYHDFFWHPMCDLLRPIPGDAGTRVRTFGNGGQNPEDLVFYYKTISITLTEDMIPDWPHEGRSTCEWCAGDTVVATPLILCAPGAASAVPLGSNFRWMGTFQKGSRIDTCWEVDEAQALISRKNTRTGLWDIIWIYRHHPVKSFPLVDSLLQK